MVELAEIDKSSGTAIADKPQDLWWLSAGGTGVKSCKCSDRTSVELRVTDVHTSSDVARVSHSGLNVVTE